MSTTTGVDKVLNALRNGQALTSRQIANRFGLANPRDAIYTLREYGYRIETVRSTNARGQTVSKYVMG